MNEGRRYGKRFGLAYLLLAAVAGGAVGGTYILVERQKGPPGPAWAAWRPTADGSAGATQIAQHVARTYRGQSARTVEIVPGSPTVKDVAIRAIAVRAPNARTTDDISLIDPSKSLMFVFCGGGKECSIAQGPAFHERAQLLRREALEVALYTFKYFHDVDSVLEFVPVKPGSRPTHALLFRRSELVDELSRPLRRTIPAPAAASARALGKVDRLTLRRYFRYDVTQARDGSAILVLDPAILLGA
jgi:hypothetical protein